MAGCGEPAARPDQFADAAHYQAETLHSFDLYPDSVHVFCERVGGGFGGKQEVLTEDICVAATLKTGRPVKLEFTREEHHGCDHAPSHGRPHQGRRGAMAR